MAKSVMGRGDGSPNGPNTGRAGASQPGVSRAHVPLPMGSGMVAGAGAGAGGSGGFSGVGGVGGGGSTIYDKYGQSAGAPFGQAQAGPASTLPGSNKGGSGGASSKWGAVRSALKAKAALAKMVPKKKKRGSKVGFVGARKLRFPHVG